MSLRVTADDSARPQQSLRRARSSGDSLEAAAKASPDDCICPHTNQRKLLCAVCVVAPHRFFLRRTTTGLTARRRGKWAKGFPAWFCCSSLLLFRRTREQL